MSYSKERGTCKKLNARILSTEKTTVSYQRQFKVLKTEISLRLLEVVLQIKIILLCMI